MINVNRIKDHHEDDMALRNPRATPNRKHKHIVTSRHNNNDQGQRMNNNHSKERNIGVDLLRGVCTLYIVGFWHLMNYTNAFPGYTNPFTIRATSVTLGTFVFISGYFIGLKDIKLDKDHILAFYKKRLLRIYPLYFLALILFTVLRLSKSKTSLKASLLISMLAKPAPKTLWFITMLMLFYIIAPWLIKLSRSTRPTKLLSYHFTIVAALTLYSLSTSILDTRIITYYPPFALGIFTASKKININRTNLIHITACATISIILSTIKTPSDTINSLINIPLTTAGAFILFHTAGRITIVSRQINTNIKRISYASYCMYLFHRPIFSILKFIFFPQRDIHQVAYLYTFCLPCIIICSFAIQKTYDRGIDKFKDRANIK